MLKTLLFVSRLNGDTRISMTSILWSYRQPLFEVVQGA